jgi:hypothetical protein
LFAATGQPPFDGGMTTVLERIVTDSPDLSRVPAEVRPLIEWCMRKEPSQRPTPQALLNRLGGISLWDDWLPESLLADIPGDRVTAVSPARSRHDDTRTTESPAAGLTAFGRQDRGEGDPGLRSRPATDPDRNDAAAGPRPRPARHRGRRRGGRRMWLIASAASLVVLAAVGGGLWLALGNGHKIPVTQPSASRSAAPEVSSPYKLTVSGVTEDACSAGLSSANGRAASITFTDKAKTQLRVYWLNYFGKRSLLVTLTPNESRQIKGNVGDAWQVADLHGCVAEFASTSTGSVIIEAAATP